MAVVVEVGGWEHECCGEPIERDQLVDLRCLRHTLDDGTTQLVESHHDLGAGTRARGHVADIRVRGRVTGIRVMQKVGACLPILRLPGGRALTGHDDTDDGHLENAWTGELVHAEGNRFLLTIRT